MYRLVLPVDMGTNAEGTSVVSATGFTAMLGGGLFVAVYVGLLALPTEATFAVFYTFTGASAIPLLFWLPASLGLYYHHRDAFGWLGRVGTAVLVPLVALSLLNQTYLLVTSEPLVDAALAIIGGEALGALLVGAAVVRARKLPHAVSGGLLLALGLPVGLGVSYVTAEMVPLDVPLVVLAVMWSVPFGAGWILLGFDMVTVPDRLRMESAPTAD